jgi:iron(III) transport system substrate-binding protein
MIRILFRLVFSLAALAPHITASAAPGTVQRFPALSNGAAPAERLTIYGTTDMEVFAPIIRDYQHLHPATEVVYVDFIAQDLTARFLAASGRGEGPDLLISSGMDLQTKLVNDGHAQPHRSALTAALPAWAHWRHEITAISYEPVVIAYNPRLLPAAQVPRTRRQLLELLREPEAPLAGRVGIYDAARSSVGYLLATQDSETGSMAGALMSALGDNQVHRENRSGVLLDRVANGELALAYNALSSYARLRIAAGKSLAIVQPEDYTLVLLRTALIPRHAPNPAQAHRFLDFLLSPQGQQALAGHAHVEPVISANATAPQGRESGRRQPLRPIRLGPGLLVYLDALKRRQFLDAWRSSVEQLPPD